LQGRHIRGARDDVHRLRGVALGLRASHGSDTTRADGNITAGTTAAQRRIIYLYGFKLERSSTALDKRKHTFNGHVVLVRIGRIVGQVRKLKLKSFKDCVHHRVGFWFPRSHKIKDSAGETHGICSLRRPPEKSNVTSCPYEGAAEEDLCARASRCASALVSLSLAKCGAIWIQLTHVFWNLLSIAKRSTCGYF
jgi:hypothetical protein